MGRFNYTYCDANVFLAYFNAEAGRAETLVQLFEEVQKDTQRKIMTSVISITEVSHIAQEKTKQRLDQKVDQALDDFWGDSSLIEFVDLNELIARQSRDSIRKAISLKYTLHPNDAIHLTSAKFVGVTEFLTYDHKLNKFSTIMEYAIKEPYISAPKLPLIF